MFLSNNVGSFLFYILLQESNVSHAVGRNEKNRPLYTRTQAHLKVWDFRGNVWPWQTKSVGLPTIPMGMPTKICGQRPTIYVGNAQQYLWSWRQRPKIRE